MSEAHVAGSGGVESRGDLVELTYTQALAIALDTPAAKK
jgi:hypothetical protein